MDDDYGVWKSIEEVVREVGFGIDRFAIQKFSDEQVVYHLEELANSEEVAPPDLDVKAWEHKK